MSEGVNYFNVVECFDHGNAMVVLVLAHKYGEGDLVKVPVSGTPDWYPVGSEIELTVKRI